MRLFLHVSYFVLTCAGTAFGTNRPAAFQVTVNGFALLSLSPQLPVLADGLTWFPVQSLGILARAPDESPTTVMQRFAVDEESQRVTLTFGNTRLTFQRGSEDAVLSAPNRPPRQLQLSAAPRIDRGDLRTMMVPLRDLASLLGFGLQWDGQLNRTALESTALMVSAGQRDQETIIAGMPTHWTRIEHVRATAEGKVFSPELEDAVHCSRSGSPALAERAGCCAHQRNLA